MDRIRRKGHVRVARGAVMIPGTPHYAWITAEAKRRGCSRAQIIRDAIRAYRKLVPDCSQIPLTVPGYAPVDF